MHALLKPCLLAFAGILLTVGPALAGRNCEVKEQILEKKIAIAKARGNSRQLAGLERSLANVRQYCTDDSLRGNAEMKVLEKQEKVMEREAELEEARAKGDAKKIAKRERKLHAAQAEVAAAEQELKALQP